MKTSYIIPQVEVDAQNYYYYQNTFSEQDLHRLESGLSYLQVQKATTFGGGGDEVRSSQIKWIPQHSQYERLYEKYLQLALEANQNFCFIEQIC